MDGSHSDQPAQMPGLSFGGPTQGPARQVYFNRLELSQILNVYGQMVAAGEWKDYAIDALKEEAVFSIFRRSQDVALYRIFKCPKDAAKQGAWRIESMDGRIVRRGKELKLLLRYFDRKRFKVMV